MPKEPLKVGQQVEVNLGRYAKDGDLWVEGTVIPDSQTKGLIQKGVELNVGKPMTVTVDPDSPAFSNATVRVYGDSGHVRNSDKKAPGGTSVFP